jgi:hypothetical protein
MIPSLLGSGTPERNVQARLGDGGAARYLNSASGTSVIAGTYVISISMTT